MMMLHPLQRVARSLSYSEAAPLFAQPQPGAAPAAAAARVRSNSITELSQATHREQDEDEIDFVMEEAGLEGARRQADERAEYAAAEAEAQAAIDERKEDQSSAVEQEARLLRQEQRLEMHRLMELQRIQQSAMEHAAADLALPSDGPQRPTLVRQNSQMQANTQQRAGTTPPPPRVGSRASYPLMPAMPPAPAAPAAAAHPAAGLQPWELQGIPLAPPRAPSVAWISGGAYTDPPAIPSGPTSEKFAARAKAWRERRKEMKENNDAEDDSALFGLALHRYDSGMFVSCEAELEDAECAICYHVAFDPPDLECCRHVFCRGCINKMQGRRLCPTCRQSFEKSKMRTLKTTKITELQVKCGAVAAGCAWTGALGEGNATYLDHMRECGFVPVQCAACVMKVPRKDLAQHQAATCGARLVTCQHCTEEIVASRLEKHQQSLEAGEAAAAPCVGSVLCPHQCWTSDGRVTVLPLRSLDQHTSIACPQRPIECLVCPDAHIEPMRDMAAHVSEMLRCTEEVAAAMAARADQVMQRKLIDQREAQEALPPKPSKAGGVPNAPPMHGHPHGVVMPQASLRLTPPTSPRRVGKEAEEKSPPLSPAQPPATLQLLFHLPGVRENCSLAFPRSQPLRRVLSMSPFDSLSVGRCRFHLISPEGDWDEVHPDTTPDEFAMADGQRIGIKVG